MPARGSSGAEGIRDPAIERGGIHRHFVQRTERPIHERLFGREQVAVVALVRHEQVDDGAQLCSCASLLNCEVYLG